MPARMQLSSAVSSSASRSTADNSSSSRVDSSSSAAVVSAHGTSSAERNSNCADSGSTRSATETVPQLRTFNESMNLVYIASHAIPGDPTFLVYTWNGATTIINDDDQGLRFRSLRLRLEAFSRPISLGFVSHGLANASVSVLVSESDIGPRAHS